MKKIRILLAGILIITFSSKINAQSPSKTDYFAGKWSVIIFGTPGGDAKMIISLDKKDTTLTGVVLDSTNTEISKISKVDVTDSSATVFFVAQGYDVNLVMVKKDEDHITGNMLNMFDAKGERIKEMKK